MSTVFRITVEYESKERKLQAVAIAILWADEEQMMSNRCFYLATNECMTLMQISGTLEPF